MPDAQRWQAGIRATRKRVLVLDVLLAQDRPITTKQVYDELSRRGQPIALTTAYRAVSSLVAAGLVHVFSQAGEATYRACGPTRHHHLICRDCGLVVEQEEEGRPDGFTVEAVYGICASCARGQQQAGS